MLVASEGGEFLFRVLVRIGVRVTHGALPGWAGVVVAIVGIIVAWFAFEFAREWYRDRQIQREWDALSPEEADARREAMTAEAVARMDAVLRGAGISTR